MTRQLFKASPVIFGCLLLINPDPYQDVQIKTTLVAKNVYMLQGRGGNIGLTIGEDGAFLVDDQYAPLSKKIEAAIARVSKHPVRFLVNTHWHGDHTGGNENFGEAGAVIVAHENVRKRVSAGQFMKAFNRQVPPAAKAALPVITFPTSMTFHWNADEIEVLHVAHAHTDGDAIIHYKKANVIHAGDTFFNGLYPFIDTGSGGDISGVIAAANKMLAMGDAKTKIIPGHGKLSNKMELTAYRDMLVKVRSNIAALIKAGKSRAEALRARPTREFDAVWGKGFLGPNRFAGIVYDNLKHKHEH